jgi:hypothetical protein
VVRALGAAPAPALADPAGFSLLAVGDTGALPADPERYGTQLAVAEAMSESDRERPVQAVVLLGDNFYPDGLLESELAARARANLARPYCRFLEIAADRAAEIADACAATERARRPPLLFALLGNHDYHSPESPLLQRTVLREFFPNWRMPAGMVSVHELPGGVSLVLFDSNPVFEGADIAPLILALHGTRGPWRILAAHHPFANRDRGSEQERHVRYRGLVLAAIAAAGVEVQLVLSGHEHNLQLLTLDPPAPGLHVVAGSGSGARSLHGPDPRRAAGFEEPGFARVDLVGSGDEARLVASLYGLPRLPGRLASGLPELLARRSVDRAGRVGED